MSPRAACRLETLGFEDVHDYAPGKADWLAHNLPVERDHDLVTVGQLARNDVVTCGLAERVGDVARRIAQSSYGSPSCTADRRAPWPPTFQRARRLARHSRRAAHGKRPLDGPTRHSRRPASSAPARKRPEDRARQHPGGPAHRRHTNRRPRTALKPGPLSHHPVEHRAHIKPAPFVERVATIRSQTSRLRSSTGAARSLEGVSATGHDCQSTVADRTAARRPMERITL